MKHARPLRRCTRPERGFTLFELFAVVTVLSVLAAITAPSMRNFFAGQQVKSASFDLTSALLLARNEALKRNGNVQLSRVGTSWNNGWQIKVVSTDAVVGSQNAIDSKVAFSGAPDSIVFNANGRVASPTSAVRIQLSSSVYDGAVRCVALTLSGHARSSTGACS